MTVEIIHDQRLTCSEIKALKRCHRYAFLHYFVGLRAIEESRPLRIGKAFHAGLDMVAKGLPVEEMLQKIGEEYQATIDIGMDEDSARAIEYERAMVQELLRGYFWRWQGDADFVQDIVASEVPFEVPIYNPDTGRSSRTYTIAGKIDQIVRLKDGRTAIREFKTTSDDISDGANVYWRRLAIDFQVSVYAIAARLMGFGDVNILYDVAKKPTIRPCQMAELDDDGMKQVFDQNGERVTNKDGSWKQSPDSAKGWFLLQRPETPEEYAARIWADIIERPEYYYQRRELIRTEADLEETKYDLWQWAQTMADAARNGRFQRDDTACFIYSRPCQYFDLCTTGYNPMSGIVPHGFTIVTDPHQELIGE